MHADGTQPHILAVNDSPELLDLFCEIFDEECFRVTARSEGDTKFDDIMRIAPDLIILDYSVGVEGVLLLQLTESPLTSHMPIILCTGVVRDEADAVWKLLNGMGVTVVFKPFDIDHFLRIVLQALGLDSDLDQSLKHGRSCLGSFRRSRPDAQTLSRDQGEQQAWMRIQTSTQADARRPSRWHVSTSMP